MRSFTIRAGLWSGISPADGTARGTLPVLSSFGVGEELGPVLRLQNGRILVIGANNHTAVYFLVVSGAGISSSPLAVRVSAGSNHAAIEWSKSVLVGREGQRCYRVVEKASRHMRRFIITGAPGAGKTAIIRRLELDGFSVVEEAATDIIAAEHAQGIAEPWTNPSFIDAIVGLQKERQIRASYQPDQVQFHDRSVVCTAALATYLGYSFSAFLASELERIRTEGIYQRRVFFIRNLGFMTPTEARRITFEETVRFERIHEETYRDLGFELVPVEAGSLMERVDTIKAAIRQAESIGID